jgi:hypothetical protein
MTELFHVPAFLLFVVDDLILILQGQIIKNPTPTLTLPRAAQALAPRAEGEGILWGFSPAWGRFYGFFSFS